MIDLLIVLAFVAYSVASGLRARRVASRSLEQYFLAGRTIPGWKAGLSMAATQYAADTPLLVAGLVATGGLFRLWRLWIYGLAFLMMGFLLGRSWRRAGVLTDAELVEVRYSGRGGVPALRALKAVYFGTLINCTVLAMVLVAATRICEVFLPWHAWLPAGLYDALRSVVTAVGLPLASEVSGLGVWVATTNNLISIVCILAFVALYSTTGGLRGVVATDVGQFGLAMLATSLYAIFALTRAGGPDALLSRLVELYGPRAGEMLRLTPGAGEALMPFLVVIGLQWFFQMNSDGTGYLAQRTMACRTEDDARLAGFGFTWAQVFLRSLLWLPVVLALLVVYPFDPTTSGGESFTAERELLFVTGIRDLMPAGAAGLMLTGMLAALASTIDTHLNWGAGYWANDLYGGLLNRRWLRREPAPREMVLVARASNVLILAIALGIMTRLDSIQSAWHLSLLFGAGIGSVLVLRWLWERINLWSEIAAIVASLIVAPVVLVAVDEEWLALLIMSGATTLAVVAVTLLTPPTEARVLDEFYRRVRPAGFWSSTARRVDDDPRTPRRELREGAWLVLTTAATIYLLLVGAIRLLFPLPDSSRMPGALLAVLGLATVPLWWGKLRGSVRPRTGYTSTGRGPDSR